MIDVRFPGGVAVEARLDGHTVRTAQPSPQGGDSAPSPCDLFLASLATCMGFYALRFCQERQLPTEGLGLTLSPERDLERRRVSAILVEVRMPPGFPEKYRDGLRRAVDHCAVKKHILEPPRFEIELR